MTQTPTLSKDRYDAVYGLIFNEDFNFWMKPYSVSAVYSNRPKSTVLAKHLQSDAYLAMF